MCGCIRGRSIVVHWEVQVVHHIDLNPILLNALSSYYYYAAFTSETYYCKWTRAEYSTRFIIEHCRQRNSTITESEYIIFVCRGNNRYAK